MTTGAGCYSTYYCDYGVIMSCCTDTVIVWPSVRLELIAMAKLFYMHVLPSTFHLRVPPFQPHTLCELLCMSKHSPMQTVVHSRRIVYLNKRYMFWAGSWVHVFTGMYPCGYKHTIKHSNPVYMQLHQGFTLPMQWNTLMHTWSNVTVAK